MFDAAELLIDAFVERLEIAYRRNYGNLEPAYPELLGWAGRMAMERIADSDALYHDVEHTIMVTLVGQEILKGKHMRQGGVSPKDWLHFMIALLCHDIGYVRGVCREDEGHVCTTGVPGETVTLPPGSTDAALTTWHVDRGKLFIRERFGRHAIIEADRVASYIELTRFPVPDDRDHTETHDVPGLVRAADLIGQLADPNYLRKHPALFYEFQETGVNEQLGYKTPADLARSYPHFFWNVVSPYVQDAISHLRVTQKGKQWVANLYAHVFATEHSLGE